MQCRKKWKRSDSSDSDSVALMTWLTTPIFNFHEVISALMTPLTTPTPTPSLVKTSLKKAEDDYNDIVYGQCTLLILSFYCFQNSKLTVKGGWVDDKVRCLFFKPQCKFHCWVY